MRYGLLGALTVETNDGPVSLRSRQQRLLLSLLLVHANQPVTTELIADTLWPAALPSDPAGAVRTQIGRLRARLGKRVIETLDGSYCVRTGPADVLDIEHFQRLLKEATTTPIGTELGLLDTALALWRGPAIGDFADHDFARAAALHLEELRAAACERRGEILLECGHVADALVTLERFVAERPEREHARALLMRALYRCGRHTDALEVYEQWRRILAEELGVDPTPELREAHLAVLDHVAGVRQAGVGATPLPRPTTPLIGREDLLQRAIAAIRECRVVTLHGTGGVGKTRFAVELAWSVTSDFADGVVFCDLSTARHARDVNRYIANAVGVNERARRTLTEQVIDRLRDTQVLLVLDNCEHVIEATASLAARIVRETSRASLLTTSREPLRIESERILAVKPLNTGSHDAASTRLFIERAKAAGTQSISGEQELDDVVRICERLDGLPLAVELAAARAVELGTADIANALDGSIDVLATRRAVPRHRTMTAVVDWSYCALAEVDQATFDALALFAGEFSLADVEARLGVAAVPSALRLAERSLLEVRQRSPRTRFQMLETLRSYAIERMTSRGAIDMTRDDHARWLTSAVESASAQLASTEEAAAARWLGDHYADIRIASAWLVGRDIDHAARIALALPRFAMWRMTSEAFRWIDTTAGAAAAIGHRRTCELLAASAIGACQRGDMDAARTAAAGASLAGDHHLVNQARADVALLVGQTEDAASAYYAAYEGAVNANDPLSAVWDLASVALAHTYGDSSTAEPLPVAEKALAIAIACGSPTAHAFAEFTLGEIRAHDDPKRAERHHRLAIELATRVASRYVVGIAQVALATLYVRVNDRKQALHHYESVISDWHANDAWAPLRITLRSLADLLERLGATDAAAVIYGAVSSTNDPLPVYGADARLLDELGARLARQLSPADLSCCIEQGRALSDAELAVQALDAIRAIA